MFHFISVSSCFITVLSYLSVGINGSFYVSSPCVVSVWSKILASVWFWFFSHIRGFPRMLVMVHSLLMVAGRVLTVGGLAVPSCWEPAHHCFCLFSRAKFPREHSFSLLPGGYNSGCQSFRNCVGR